MPFQGLINFSVAEVPSSNIVSTWEDSELGGIWKLNFGKEFSIAYKRDSWGVHTRRPQQVTGLTELSDHLSDHGIQDVRAFLTFLIPHRGNHSRQQIICPDLLKINSLYSENFQDVINTWWPSNWNEEDEQDDYGGLPEPYPSEYTQRTPDELCKGEHRHLSFANLFRLLRSSRCARGQLSTTSITCSPSFQFQHPALATISQPLYGHSSDLLWLQLSETTQLLLKMSI